MDEAVDETVHPPTLEEKTPEFLSSVLYAGFHILSEFGWYMVIFGSLFYYAWQKKIQPVLFQWKKQEDEKAYAAKYHKDPARFQALQEAMEATRRKMQEELEIRAQQYLEKQKEIAEANRIERIADWERHEKGLGYRSKMKPREGAPGTSSQTDPTSSLKPEYNPLMGPGGSSGYRPQKRSCCPGGGCG